jgi:hypothetical protein
MYFIAYSGKLRITRMRHKAKVETRRELFEDELNEY